MKKDYIILFNLILKMSDLVKYKILCEYINSLKTVNTDTTYYVSQVRDLIFEIEKIKDSLLDKTIILTDEQLKNYGLMVENAKSGKKIRNRNVKTTHEFEMFQMGSSPSNVNLDVVPNSLIPPEKGTLIQKLWKIQFSDMSFGYVVVSDTSNLELSKLLNGQVSTVLQDAPNASVENLPITIDINLLSQTISSHPNDISSLFTGLQKPGLVARQLRDIDIDSDPSLSDIDSDIKLLMKNAVKDLNNSQDPDTEKLSQLVLEKLAIDAGLFSTSLGPVPNFEYSDLKRFKLKLSDTDTVSVTLSMPVVAWGSDISGFPLRNPNGPRNKSNRKDDGTSYIVDLGGIDPVIRQGAPNPLPPTKFFANGPAGATETEGALDRYGGGKCMGFNTTPNTITIETIHREKMGKFLLTIPPFSAIWKLDRATFDGGNRHAYYTVYSSSRPPPAGFMGVVFAPKQNRLGRGRGEIASGVTLANGISETGKTFNNQNHNGPILNDLGDETPSSLKGVTCSFDGHGYHPVDLLQFLQLHSFSKGSQYLTIPSDATLDTVEDVLIPEGQFIPQITQALGVLMQFGNGKYIPDGGPSRFQSGLIPFLPGTLSYTPEWHINFIYYNCGQVEADGQYYQVTDVAKTQHPSSWVKPNFNVSFGAPGPSPDNSQSSGYNPNFPDTFDPVQLRAGIKDARCTDFIDNIEDSVDSEITLQMVPRLEEENKLLVTEAPGGGLRGWVKFLVVNCPLPVVLKINVVGEEESDPSGDPTPTGECATCTCSRNATSILINGDLNPIWLEEDNSSRDVPIDDRIVNFKVGDNIEIKATSGTQHGFCLRLDDLIAGSTPDPSKTLAEIQNDVLLELEQFITINNKDSLENNFIAQSDDLINFHGGVPITFTPKSVVNPISTPNGVVIASFTINNGSEGQSGTIACTVHGSSMSFRFKICPQTN